MPAAEALCFAAVPTSPFERAPPDRGYAALTRGLDRVAWTVITVGSWAVLALARWLRPDARGHGTHEQLGLPPCAFAAVTGVPCPGCGLTTSFAHMAHGSFVRAFESHLMGPLLFTVVLFLALYGPYALRHGRSLRVLVEARPALPAVMLTALAGVLTFAVRCAHAR